ncbi:hypothetical protein Tco_0306674, partial [Tanacetum coccineum]
SINIVEVVSNEHVTNFNGAQVVIKLHGSCFFIVMEHVLELLPNVTSSNVLFEYPLKERFSDGAKNPEFDKRVEFPLLVTGLISARGGAINKF